MTDEYLYTKKTNIFKTIRKIIFFILESVLAVVLGWLVIKFAVEKNVMVGNAMSKTIEDKDVLIINKLAYKRSAPERFDVIAYNQSGSEHSFYTVRRIIGLPGEKVLISDGMIYINGELLEEKINVEPMRLAGLAEEEIELQENEYFVLADNRNDAEDSRFSNVGLISGSSIIGKAVIRLSPTLSIVDKLNLKEETEKEE